MLAAASLLLAPPGGSFDVLIAAPAGPVRVRFAVTVDRRPLADGPAAYRAALVRRLDGDGDGRVSRTEAAAAPTPRVLGAAGDGREALDELLRRFDAAGEAGLPATQFAAWAADAMAAPVRAAARTAGDETAGVFDLLDADGDGGLTRAELAGDEPLRRDFDGDGTLSAAELAPYRDPAAAADRRQFPPGHMFRLDPAPRAGASPDVTVAVSLVARSFGLPRAAVTNNAAPDRVAVEPDRRGFALTVDGSLRVTVAADRAEAVASDAVSLGLLDVLRADANADGALDADEFPAAALPGGPLLDDVDCDGDGLATRTEVRAYLEEDVRRSGSRVYALAEATAEGLFTMLDANADGRLTATERAVAAQALAAGTFPPDRDGDGTLAKAELAGTYALHIGPGRPVPPDTGMMTPQMTPDRPVAAEPADGPAWFVRSDRNGDGAVAWREFPGPRAAFDRLDADADGTLTPAEAGGG